MNELTPVNHGAVLPSVGELQTMLTLADTFVKSGLLPAGIKTSAAALLIIQKGKELGIQPTYALSNIAVIQGKPTAGAELLAALIYRDHGDHALRVTETNDKQCVIEYRRRTWAKPETFAFTMDDARKAELSGSATWKKFPAAMLRARCISAVARMAFPDSIGGMYTPEELGAEVAVDAEGTVTVVQENTGQIDYHQERPDVVADTGEIVSETLVLEQPTPEAPKEQKPFTNAEQHAPLDRQIHARMMQLAQRDQMELTDVEERVLKAGALTGSIKEQTLDVKRVALDWLIAEMASVPA
jgi:hypothetical protein